MRVALALACVFTGTIALAQYPAKVPAAVATAKDLPVRQVVLYKNGIGYFEHSGSVSGNQHVAIDFTSSQLNDVLQSLTILDENGGRIGGVNYNSTTPLAEQLKSLSLAMTDNPTSTELFQALRGQRVEVTGGAGGALTGRLMSIESRTETSTTQAGSTTERYYLTLVTTAGAVRVIELTPALSVRPLDSALQGQLDRYLELLSSTRSTGLRHLTLDALGQGQRQLRVSYISEVPVWKSTYRLVFPKDAADKAILQGWAVVDNTIGSDWDNVQLSLVAGAPQSFIQPLSQPLYLRRPEVPISTTAMTTPQTHEAGDVPLDTAEISTTNNTQMINNLPIAGRDAGELMKLKSGAAQMRMRVATGANAVVPMPPPLGSAGMGNGSGGGIGISRPSDAIEAGDVSTNSFDDFFQYTLAQPVTIHKNESAMVPILQENLPAERVTLWSASEPLPFRAVWLENTSKLTFDSGNFSIFESGVFAGQGLLDPIHPGEKRLLSYAADQAIRVRQHPEEPKRELEKIHIAARGHVLITYGTADRSTYIASNSAETDRVVVLEVPRRANRDLATSADAAKPAETAATLYRFRLAVPAHKSASLLIADQGPDYEDWWVQPDADQSSALQRLAEEAPGIAEQLKPIYIAQQQIAAMKAQLQALDQKAATIASDEARARDNLTALKGNDGAKRFVDELNHAEDELELTRKQSADLKDKEKAAVETLRQMLAVFTVDWTATAK